MLRITLLAIIQLWLIQSTVGVVPQIQRLNVQCDRSGMRVNVDFDIPFNGIIFSKGHYSDLNCRYVSPGSQRNSYNFFIPSALCGTVQTDARRDGTVGFKNVIIIQNDPEYQEVWDMARKISCDWVTRIDKYVTFAPFGVDMLGIKEIAFPGDTVDCWMDIQRGHGPFAPTIGGVVPIGEKLTIVIYIRDRDGSFDIHVKDCYAYDSPDYKRPGVRAIQLTDVRGCPIKEKLVKGFYRTRDVRNSGATIIAYGVINAFKFPEAMDVFLACNVEVCKGGCENPCQPEVSMAGGDGDVQQQIDEQSKGPFTRPPPPDSQDRVDSEDDEENIVPTTTMRNDVGTDEVSGGDGDNTESGGTDTGGTETGDTETGGTDTGGTETGGTENGSTEGEGTGTADEGTSSNGDEGSNSETESNNETEDTNTDSESSSEASEGSTEAPSAETTSAASEEEEEDESRRAASNPVRVAVKTRAKKSNLRSARLKAPPKASPKANLKARPKTGPKAVPRASPKTSAKLRASTTTRKRKRQQTGRGKRGKRSIIISGLNGTFSEMTHSISIISPVEDFDESELEIWQRAKEAENRVCFSALGLITSSLLLTSLAILFSMSLLLSFGRLRQRYGQKSLS